MPADKKRAYASNALLYTAFILGAIVVVNLLSTRVFGRIDLTENKMYTLSQPSKDLVKKLPDYLTVKAFISADLPPELKTVSRYVRDLIDEYKNSSNGKFRWDAIDPGNDKKLEDEANRCKVQKIQIQVLRNQKFELGSYYLGLCLEYGTQVESIPQVARPEGLEYQVSSLIKRMTQRKRKVAFTTGHGESDTNTGFQSLKQDLEQEYEVTTVNPSTAEFGKDVDAIVVGGPKQAFDDKGRKEIDKFVMTGKGAVFLVDGMTMGAPGGGMHGMEQMQQIKMAQANDPGLAPLLDAYGFKVGTDFVFDEQAMAGPIDVGGRKMLATAPFFVGVETDKTTGMSVLDGVRGLVFPFASSVELTGPLAGNKTPSGGKLWRLAASSKEGWKQTGFFVLNANTKLEKPKEHASYAFGYAYQGPLKSAFAPAQAPAESTADKPPTEAPKPVRLVVIGDSDFASDEYVQLARFLPFYGAGAQLLFNAISWTGEDESLTPLRAKNLSPRPIKVSSEATASVLQWLNVLGLPVAFCLFGLVRWRVRRAGRLRQKI
jgi:gliding-associated putative ABC transporter substrate-binding component GldG